MEFFTAGAIATLAVTKVIEKTSEIFTEKVVEEAGKLMQLLKRKSPDTASAIELAAQHPELVERQPEDYGQAVLVEKVESAAKSDSEIALAVQALADAVKSQPQTSQNITNMAEKIYGNIQGGFNPNLTQNF
ncbi:hypothetical protein [Microcoleus vaginatus]|uniref:hypothetical protein n=1 Tax=Microcoleus vaginatus TaxID=119532 RepID=UPI001F600319|nr:hypothetical protein D0A37_00800 [Microcoleus vaginatus HSN003]